MPFYRVSYRMILLCVCVLSYTVRDDLVLVVGPDC